MLGDDIMDGTKRGVSIVAHAAKNVLKGAVLFGLVTAAAVSIGLFAAPIIEGAGILTVGGEMLSTIGTALFGSGAAQGAAMTAVTNTASFIAGWAGTAGIVGGAVTGAASLLPGKEEGFSFRRMYRKIEDMGKESAKAPAMEQEASTYRDNPYSAPAPQPIVVQQPAPLPQPQPQPIIVHAQPQQAPQQPVVIIQQPTSPQTVAPHLEAQPQEVASTTMDNPYFRPGKGTELMQRGNAAESTISK